MFNVDVGVDLDPQGTVTRKNLKTGKKPKDKGIHSLLGDTNQMVGLYIIPICRCQIVETSSTKNRTVQILVMSHWKVFI